MATRRRLKFVFLYVSSMLSSITLTTHVAALPCKITIPIFQPCRLRVHYAPTVFISISSTYKTVRDKHLYFPVSIDTVRHRLILAQRSTPNRRLLSQCKFSLEKSQPRPLRLFPSIISFPTPSVFLVSHISKSMSPKRFCAAWDGTRERDDDGSITQQTDGVCWPCCNHPAHSLPSVSSSY